MVRFWPTQRIMSDVGNRQALLKSGGRLLHVPQTWLGAELDCVGEAHPRNGSGKTEEAWVPDPEKPPSQPWAAPTELLDARETP